jgi:hypothetical protein
MVFDGSELLRFAIASIRQNVDFISVVYQTTSYFGNTADQDLVPNVKTLEEAGMIDKLVHCEPDLKQHHKVNELNWRNIGLQLSRDAGCTHHISADVDEFYKPDELEYAKKCMEDGYDYSIAPYEYYYKDPRYLIVPCQNLITSFIHTVDNKYEMNTTFPHNVETTRHLKEYKNCKLFHHNEFIIHHMSYVRRDIRRKLCNSDNGRFYKKLNDFVARFDKYQLGDRVCIAPDFMNRKTVLVENLFGITL